MNLSKPVKLLVAVLTAWPLLDMVLFMGFFAITFVGMGFGSEPSSATSAGPPLAFVVFFVAQFVTILLTFGLMAFYVLYLFKTNRVPQDKKALWAAVILLGSTFAMPVFFYLYVWPEDWPRNAGVEVAAEDSAQP